MGVVAWAFAVNTNGGHQCLERVDIPKATTVAGSAFWCLSCAVGVLHSRDASMVREWWMYIYHSRLFACQFEHVQYQLMELGSWYHWSQQKLSADNVQLACNVAVHLRRKLQ